MTEQRTEGKDTVMVGGTTRRLWLSAALSAGVVATALTRAFRAFSSAYAFTGQPDTTLRPGQGRPEARTADPYLTFDGTKGYIEIPDSADFSVSTTGQLTISVWLRANTLTFPRAEGSGYVHWMGKGEKGKHEWTFRMYSQGNTEHRGNRISFYVFNLSGGLGVGSYFQDTVEVGRWIHVVGAADDQRTYIYRDGVLRGSTAYRATITPAHGSAPVRIATRDFASFFQGSIREVRVWNRLLTKAEVINLHTSGVASKSGLVAEYLLNRDIAHDSTGLHDGDIRSATWREG